MATDPHPRRRPPRGAHPDSFAPPHNPAADRTPPAPDPGEPSQFAAQNEPGGRPVVWRLDHFLKYAGIADTGGQAKLMIQSGEVRVNGEVETRRRRKLSAGDIVDVAGQSFSLDDGTAQA